MNNMKHPIYVISNNVMIRKAGEALLLDNRQSGKRIPCPSKNVSHVIKYGNSQVSEQVLNYLADNKIPLFRFSYGGKYCGIFVPPEHNIGKTRLEQYKAYFDNKKRLDLAKKIVFASTKNKITLLKKKGAKTSLVNSIKKQANNVLLAENIESLRGVEGGITRTYYEGLKKLFTNFVFTKREYNPPKDEINALLSFAYALLYCEIISKIMEHGLDVFVGVIHEQNNTQEPLAYDLSELFKCWADKFILDIINQKKIMKEHFSHNPDSVLLNTYGKAIFLKNWNAFLLKTQKKQDKIIGKKEIIREEVIKFKKALQQKAYDPYLY